MDTAGGQVWWLLSHQNTSTRVVQWHACKMCMCSAARGLCNIEDTLLGVSKKPGSLVKQPGEGGPGGSTLVRQRRSQNAGKREKEGGERAYLCPRSKSAPDERLAKRRWTHCATPGTPMTAPCRVRERRKAGAASLDAATRAIEGRVIGRGRRQKVWQLLSCQNESTGQVRVHAHRTRTHSAVRHPDVEDASLDTSEGPPSRC